MSDNKVWVTWRDADESEPLGTLITGLNDGAVVDELRQAFVNQQNLHSISPAKIKVHEREGGDRLREDVLLQPYFVRKEDETNDNPGRSRDTALFLTLPSSSTSTRTDDKVSSSAFLVGATVIGARQSNGARGNVYKFLEKNMGHYSKKDGIQISYENENLKVKSYFLSYESACRFQSALNEWEIHKELVNLEGVLLDPLTPARVDAPSDLLRIYLQNYIPQDSESPCHSINQLHSYRLFVPPTTQVDATSLLGKYQCLDKQVVGYNPYKCHLKDKAKFKTLQSNENNMVAASWQLHQWMDGLNSVDGIPGVALSVVETGNERSAQHEYRIMVRLSLEFRDEYLAGLFQGNNMPKRIDDKNWQVTVYVEDSATFCDCIQWKHADTKKQWESHDSFLNDD